jgi:hypothetical protein
MHIAKGLDVDQKHYFGRREDLSFIVRFNWKSSSHLKEAIQVLLAARLDDTQCETVAKVEEPKHSDTLDDREFRQIRRIIASNPNTPPGVLSYLAKIADSEILVRVAENPRTPLYTLERLARSPVADVRAAVADNLNVSPDILTILVADSDDDVRYHLADNPHMPEELLVALTEDSNPYVRYRAEATLMRVSGGSVVKGDFFRIVGDDRETNVF